MTPSLRAVSLATKTLFGALLLTSCASPGDSPTDASEPTSSRPAAIIGGTLDNDHQAVVALYISSQSALCTATVIGFDGTHGHALTAAHCLTAKPLSGSAKTVDPEDLFVFMGDDARVHGLVFLVTDVVMHPSYANKAPGEPFDVGVVTFDAREASHDAKGKVVLGQIHQPMPTIAVATDLSSDGLTDAAAGLPVEVVGFGVTSLQGSTNSRRRHITLPLAHLGNHAQQGPDDAFTLSNHEDLSTPDSTVIGGGCEGDSGGPALLDQAGSPVVVGTVSHGDSTCSLFTVFTRVGGLHDTFLAPYLVSPATGAGGSAGAGGAAGSAMSGGSGQSGHAAGEAGAGGEGGEGGAGGEENASGSTGGDAAGAGGSAGAAAAQPASPDEGGCAVSKGRPGSSPAGGVTLTLAALAALVRGRRRQAGPIGSRGARTLVRDGAVVSFREPRGPHMLAARR